MNLDFAALSAPPPTTSVSKLWGQAGTAGTGAFMRVPASSGTGDGTGTGGDTCSNPTIGRIAAAAEGDRVAMCCPPLSPPCPQPAAHGKPHEIKVSPVSPPVPAMVAVAELDDGFNHEAYEERAAIMEFDGGLPRADAEAAARTLLGSTTTIYARS